MHTRTYVAVLWLLRFNTFRTWVNVRKKKIDLKWAIWPTDWLVQDLLARLIKVKTWKEEWNRFATKCCRQKIIENIKTVLIINTLLINEASIPLLNILKENCCISFCIAFAQRCSSSLTALSLSRPDLRKKWLDRQNKRDKSLPADNLAEHFKLLSPLNQIRCVLSLV